MTSTLCMMWISSAPLYWDLWLELTAKWICQLTREVGHTPKIFLHFAWLLTLAAGLVVVVTLLVDGNFNWLLPPMIIWQIIKGTGWPTIFVYIYNSPFTWMFVSVSISWCKYRAGYTCNYLCMCTCTCIVRVLCLAFLFSNSISFSQYVIIVGYA